MSKGVSQLKTAKEQIFEAFLQLLHTYSYEQLTVKQIVIQAQVSRSTFYLYFSDKEALYNYTKSLLNNQLLGFYDPHEQNVQTEHIPLQLCRHILKYRSFYMLQFDNAQAMKDLADQLVAQLDRVYGDSDYGIFASYGTIGYLSYWIKNDFLLSPAEVAENLLKIAYTDWTNHLKSTIHQ